MVDNSEERFSITMADGKELRGTEQQIADQWALWACGQRGWSDEMNAAQRNHARRRALVELRALKTFNFHQV